MYEAFVLAARATHVNESVFLLSRCLEDLSSNAASLSFAPLIRLWHVSPLSSILKSIL